MVEWEQTDDPDDPCSYEVQWMTADGRNDFDPYEEEAVPFIGPNKIAKRVYKYVHTSCMLQAMEYTLHGD